MPKNTATETPAEPAPGPAAAALSRFGPATRAWFEASFAAPTQVQSEAWQAISSGEHSLVIAPTGSGKTLAAFLHALDRLTSRPDAERRPGVKVLYVSPLKALAVDVERNLRAPLRGIALAAQRLGLPEPRVEVAVRSGDTPASERRRIATKPPDILITTPESLFLMLSSQAQEVLSDVETVILDEVHAMAGTKRGAHLMVSLERLERRARAESVQRIALSATVRPPERVARFVGGDRPVRVVNPPASKTWELSVDLAVPDLQELSQPIDPDDPDAGRTQSIWPFLENRLLDLVLEHRSTICFVNSRRVAERVTSHLNEQYRARIEWPDDAAPDDVAPKPSTPQAPATRPPAEVMAQSGQAPPHPDDDPHLVVARAHHGSVSKERRAEIESQLKAGTLRCVVATSSLELGIDMGAVDLVVQVQSPPSVASGLQRVGRAGHQVGASSHGVLLPAHRADLLESAVVAQRMAEGQIEEVPRLLNPLDVLAQQIVSICLDPGTTVDAVFGLVRRSDPFRDLPWSAFEAVLDMLAGRYPSEDFTELRPRLTWDRATGELTARPGARRLVTTSGGTIPDRGLFGVFLPGAGDAAGKSAPGRRVGELDEEMVYESRVGDVFTLGTSSWRIDDITPSQVIVTPAPGQVSRLPFWRGDLPARPAELGRALGQFVQHASSLTPQRASAAYADLGLNQWAGANLATYLSDQARATEVVPSAETIVVERFRDELGDWRLCVHSFLGTGVLGPWALAIQARARERYGVEAQVSATNDGIIARIPDIDSEPPGLELISFDADDAERIITEEVFGSALFASRFRECAARALLLPRRDPSRRTPLWQQRLRSAQLLSVASGYPDFPIVLETMRECLEDVFDLPSLITLLGDIAARRVRLVEVETAEPSPFARSLTFGYIGEFIYDGDQPLAERRAAALSVDPAMLAELLGHEGGSLTFDLEAAAEVEAELQWLDTNRRAASAENLWDMLRTIGPLTREECLARGDPERLDHASEWLADLDSQRRIGLTRVNGREVLAVADDHALLRDALGVPVPPGLVTGPETSSTEAVNRLVERWLRTHVLVTADDLVDRYGLPAARAREAIRDALARGAATSIDAETALRHDAVVHRTVLQRVRRRTLARLRAGIEPVEPAQLARFLPQWQELDAPGLGAAGLANAVEQLAGWPVPASMLESLVLPARVADYSPMLLDQALAAGEVVWTGHGAIGTSDGWVQLWPADAVLAAPTDDAPTELAARVLAHLETGGAWRVPDLARGLDESESAISDALWQLAWSGRATSDTLAPVRALATTGALRTPHRATARRRVSLRQVRLPQAQHLGRWSALQVLGSPTDRAVLAAQLALSRHGVLVRGSATTEATLGSWSDSYRVLSGLEDAGVVRRGYFVDGLGAAQFAVPGAVDRLRETPPGPPVRLLAACDPANPYGAAIPWPDSDGHRPTRKAGALVVLADGQPVVWLERGVHTAVTFGAHNPEVPASEIDQRITTAFSCVADAVRAGRLATMTLERVNQQGTLDDSRVRAWLTNAGFTMTPQGFRVRANGT